MFTIFSVEAAAALFVSMVKIYWVSKEQNHLIHMSDCHSPSHL